MSTTTTDLPWTDPIDEEAFAIEIDPAARDLILVPCPFIALRLLAAGELTRGAFLMLLEMLRTGQFPETGHHRDAHDELRRLGILDGDQIASPQQWKVSSPAA